MGFLRRTFTSGKGSLDLDVTNRVYHLGEEINGLVKIHAKRDLGPARLFVALVCVEEVTTWQKGQDGRPDRRTRRNERFRTEVDLGFEERFAADSSVSRPFTVALPQPQQGNTPHEDTPEWALGVMAILDTLGSKDRRFWWEVRARYDIRRIALADERRISVNNFETI